MRVKSLIRGVAGSCLMLALAGCSGDMSDLQSYVNEVKARPGGRIEPLPQIEPPPSFAYAAATERPPFTPYRPGADQPGGGPRPDAARPKDFLERYPLDTLRMVGSIAREGSLYGLVQDPDGLIHRILPGNYLGQNDGRVTDISDGEIALVEIVPDGVGGYVERPAGLALSE